MAVGQLEQIGVVVQVLVVQVGQNLGAVVVLKILLQMVLELLLLGTVPLKVLLLGEPLELEIRLVLEPALALRGDVVLDVDVLSEHVVEVGLHLVDVFRLTLAGVVLRDVQVVVLTPCRLLPIILSLFRGHHLSLERFHLCSEVVVWALLVAAVLPDLLSVKLGGALQIRVLHLTQVFLFLIAFSQVLPCLLLLTLVILNDIFPWLAVLVVERVALGVGKLLGLPQVVLLRVVVVLVLAFELLVRVGVVPVEVDSLVRLPFHYLN